MENVTLSEFECSFQIRIITNCPYKNVHVSGYFPDSGDYIQIEIVWDSLKSCNNKYVREVGYMSGDGYQAQNFLARKARKSFYVGIEDLPSSFLKTHNNWEYVGFINTKYGVILTYLNRKTPTIYFGEV